jgi:hypothetical protein
MSVTVKTAQEEPLKHIMLPTQLWDIPGNRPTWSLAAGEYLLVVQFLYSRYPAEEIVRSTSADACIPALYKVLYQFGIPTEITSDNRPPHNIEKYMYTLTF